ncbi:MAG TPA: GtrA family protein [Acetobacteraceae bacterium]|nr:GtrA family protein [Acetobacteraceae bacterium]
MRSGPMIRALYARLGGGAVERTTRYTLVGAICAIFSNAVIILGSWMGGDYITLSILAFLIVTPCGYLMHTRFTFGVGRSWQEFIRFASGVAATLPLYFLLMGILCSGLHLPVAMGAPVTTVALYIWNYISAHWALRSRLPFGRQNPAS